MAVFGPPTKVRAGTEAVTYNGQAASIFYQHCTTCHHPGGAGPFSLMTYEDAKRRAPQIRTVTQSRYMPPWLPEPGFGDFTDSRRLKDEDVETLRKWIDGGMPQGDPAAAPAAPHYASRWELGEPDLVLSVEKPFAVAASGTDVFRNFVLPYPLKETKYVRAMEILPGAPRVVHHANVILDRTASYRETHADWREGVAGMELLVDSGSSFDPDSHFLFWKPDSPLLLEPEDMTWRLDPGNDLILNMHLKPTGKPETVEAQIGLWFSSRPPVKQPMLLQLEHDSALDIPAGDAHFVVEDQLKLPIAVNVLGVYPHAHYLGKDLEAWAMLPGGKKQWLVWIKDWDIDRQSVYHFSSPVLLPQGTVLHMRYVYDNSAGNLRNPHSPPIRVKAGNRSEDEMGHLWLQVLPVDPVVDGRDARLLLEQAWMESRLNKNAKDPVALYNLAATVTEEGQEAEAVSLYRRILQGNPRDVRTLTALGAAEEGAGDWKQARQSYASAIAIDADAGDARFNLAHLDLEHGEDAEAEQQMREVLRRKPGDAAAHSGLGVALLHEARVQPAMEEFDRALAIDPRDWTALENRGEVALAAGDLPRAIGELQAALAVRDDADARQKLALAFAQSGRPGDAAEELKAALRLRPQEANTHAILSQVDSSLGLLPEAIREAQAALAIAPKDADGWNNLGVLEARAGRTPEAREDFAHALKLEPDHAQARANLEHLGAAKQ